MLVDELLGVTAIALEAGTPTYVGFPFVPETNTLARIFPVDSLPAASTETAATVIDLWDAGSQSFATRDWLSNNPSHLGWRVPGSFADANNVPVDLDTGALVLVRSGAGNQTLYISGSASQATQASRTIAASGYTLANHSWPARVSLQSSGLASSGFSGSVRVFLSDMALVWNASTKRFDFLHWYHTPSATWIDTSNGQASTVVLEPGQPVLLLRRQGSSFNWTSPRPYSLPFQGP